MANGDFDVRTISKSRIAGGGHDINGAAKNNKIQVVVEITGDYITGGIVLNAIDLGLQTIDAINTTQVYSDNTAAPSATNPRTAHYIATSGNEGNLVIVTNNATQAEAAQTNFAVCVVAFGDGADAPELT